MGDAFKLGKGECWWYIGRMADNGARSVSWYEGWEGRVREGTVENENIKDL